MLTGTVIDASPHVITIWCGDREERLALQPGTSVWRGSPVESTALEAGDWVVARLAALGPGVADRVWANIGRVTGLIVERSPSGVIVDAGRTVPRQTLVIPPRAASRVQVRFPHLEPGYLIDVIGLRAGGVVEGLVPATSQPAFREGGPVSTPALPPHILDGISGSATWHEPSYTPPDAEGVEYPALDPHAQCGEEPRPVARCLRLPFLSVGSLLEVRNECTGSWRTLPVIGCAATAAWFCDRCVTCGTSPRGRVADLTLASFVALGGELERGCFNATVSIGPPR
ncbi:MAG TPA: hypothetical protein VG253_11610 [Streptosporangiaceae bacterium]|nr:hypothetical protein [Streptosporangiaceae bacterium]